MGLPNEIHPFLATGNDANRYKIPYSLRFRNDGSNGAKLVRTFQNAGNRKTWTWSVWLKLGRQAQADSFLFAYNSGGGYNRTYHELLNGTITIGDYTTGYVWQVATNQLLRDYSAWYHYVVQFDTTQATASNRVRLYLNGSQITSLSTANYPSLNYDAYINQAAEHVIGSIGYANNSGFDGYMAEMHFIDGYAYDPSYFGYTDTLTNQWQPKKYTGAYGTNGFYLPFKDNTTATSENKVTYSEAFDDASWAKPVAPVAPTVTANAIAAPNGSVTADRLEFSGPTAHPVYKESAFTIANGSTVTTSVYLKNYIAGSYNLQCFIYTPTNLDSYTNIVFDSNGVLTSCTPVGGDAANTTAEFYDVGNGWYRVVCRHTNNSGSSESGCRISVGQNGNSGASGVYAWGAQMELSPTVGPYFTTTSSAQSSTLQIGRDESSNKVAGWNNWAASGISLTSGTTYDVLKDVPVSWDDGGTGRGNYCTLNPLISQISGVNISATLSNANLTATDANNPSYNSGSNATIGFSSGKWYWEAVIGSSGPTYTVTGLAFLNPYQLNHYGIEYAPYNLSGTIRWASGGSSTNLQTGVGSVIAGDIISLVVDADNKTIAWYKNNVQVGTTVNYTSYLPSASYAVWPSCWMANGTGASLSFNFGQRPFSYTPPAGYKALNTYNLADPSLPLV